MRKRMKLGRRYSKKLFKRHVKTHKRNVHRFPVRGGIRF